MGVAPRALMFAATLAAPPNLFSYFSISTIGIGASGDCLFIDPHMYESIIESPTIKTLIFLKLLKMLCQSEFTILSKFC